MATRNAQFADQGNGVLLITWSGLLNGDNGNGVECPWMADKTVHFTGTVGVGGSVSLKGTNLSAIDIVNDIILSNPSGTALTFTAAGLKQILENPLLIYPHVTAGDGSTAFVCSIVVKPNFKL